MREENEIRRRGDSGGAGAVFVVGIGPGGLEHLTAKAKEAIAKADCIVGYARYAGLVRPLAEGKEVFANGMTHEVERCRAAIDMALKGKTVAVVSSGDSGIYGMAGLILQLLPDMGAQGMRVEVIPGVPAFVSAAALLGAPLMHDFASISLSDLLTERALIEQRIDAAAKADFIIVLYNPKSSKRVEGLARALEIIARHRAASTPVGLVRNATRDGEEATLTTLGGAGALYERIDMLSILIIGNSATYSSGSRMITPRGYKGV